MSLDELLTLLRPPAEPVAHSGDWSAVEIELGVGFPSDYKEFLSVYGVGSLRESFWVLSPFSARPGFGLQEKLAFERRKHHDLIEDYQLDVLPYPIFPEQGGILPWGSTAGGCMCSWVTVGSPDNWTVFVENPEFDWEEFECSMTTFLADAFARRIDTFVLHPDLWLEPLTYVPLS